MNSQVSSSANKNVVATVVSSNKKGKRKRILTKKRSHKFSSRWVKDKDLTKPSRMSKIGVDREKFLVELKKNKDSLKRMAMIFQSPAIGIHNTNSLRSQNNAAASISEHDEENAFEDTFDQYGEKGVLAANIFGDFGFSITRNPGFSYR